MERAEVKNIITFTLIFLIVAFLSFLVFKPVFNSVLWAIVLGYILYPVSKYLGRFIKNENLRASIMLCSVIIVFILPLFVFLNTIVSYLLNVRKYINIREINAFISSYTSGFLGSSINLNVENAINFIIGLLKDFFLSLPQKILGIFVMFFVLFYIFKSGKDLSQKFIKMVPVQDKYKKLVLDKFSSLVYGSFYALIMVSIAQAILSFILFLSLQISLPWLWALLILMTGMLPFIGPAAVYLPLVLYLSYTGEYVKAWVLLLFGMVVLSFVVDWLLKQTIMSSTTKVHPLIILTGIIGGIQSFGLIGIVLGPLILIVLKIFFEIYHQS